MKPLRSVFRKHWLNKVKAAYQTKDYFI